MRDPKRINTILGKIRTIWENNPDMRFFQLLDHIRGSLTGDLFYFEDDAFEEILNQLIRKRKNENKG